MRALILGALVAAPTTWSFESDEIDQPPAGFEFATTRQTPSGRWVVRKAGEAKVLAQTDTDKTRDRFALAIVKDSSFKDLSLSVRGMAVSGEVDQSVGLVWRYQDSENYYLCRSNVLEGNVRLYRVVNGNRIKFADEDDDLKLKAGQWQALRVVHRGAEIKVYLGDDKLFEAKDRTFPEAGKIGLWTKADSVTYFDDLTAEELKK